MRKRIGAQQASRCRLPAEFSAPPAVWLSALHSCVHSRHWLDALGEIASFGSSEPWSKGGADICEIHLGKLTTSHQSMG